MDFIDEKQVRENYRKLTMKLIEKNRTITTMESATAGQIASLITDTEGSSAIFFGALVSYSNEIKQMFGVPKEVIDAFSVYSEETAKAMAVCCKEKMQADIGIGITGTMGNIDPNNKEASEPGIVYFAIAFDDETISFKQSIPVQESRLLYKLAVAQKIYEEIENNSNLWYY